MFADLIASQLTDPFRIGLIIALVVTMARTRDVTGAVLPLALGVAFVAWIIPATMGSPAPQATAFGAGLVANGLLLAVALAGRELVRRYRR